MRDFMVAAVFGTGCSRRSAVCGVTLGRPWLSVAGWMMRVMSDMPAAGSVKVVVGAALSDRFEKRYVIVDQASGEVVDDDQGYGYKTAQNAHRADAFELMPPMRKRQRDAAQRQVRPWCRAHPEFMQHVFERDVLRA